MSVFSTNQARHLYVATACEDAVYADDMVGTIAVHVDDAAENMYFEYNGHGGLTRSDIIKVKNVSYAKITRADKMATLLKAVGVTLDGDLVAGQAYILKIAFRQFAGMSDEDIYTKFGMVHVTSKMNASDFYANLAISLAKNFSKETTKLVEIFVVGGDGPETVTGLTKLEDLTGSYTGILISEVPQEWTLGIKPQVPVYFDVLPGTVIVDGDEVIWGKTMADTWDTIPNGKKIADLEYFCMGERGDQYRGINWPNNIPTKYLVDPEGEYDVIDIHYAYTGSNESVQKSEKTITIVGNTDVINLVAGKIVSYGILSEIEVTS